MYIEELVDFRFAEEIEEAWNTLMEEGFTIPEGTTQILEQYELLEGKEKMLLYLTLGLIQAELEEIDNRVKDEVGEIIATRKATAYLYDHEACRNLIKRLKKRCR